jgi:putative spermidine/putrescine transport system substrate-binding protein
MVLWTVLSRVSAGLVFLGSALLWVASTVQAQEPPKPPQIVFNDSGGDMQKAMRESFYSEFEKQYGIRVVTTSPVDAGKLKAMVESGNIEWTVTEIGPEEAMLAEKEGLLEPLDRKIIDLSDYPKHLQDRKYIMPKGVYTTVLGYRTDTFPEGKGPTSWADFWDVKKFPGPRTLRDSPIDNLEFALLADGVAPDKVYPIDVARAFKKLDELKPHITVWWKTGAQSAQLLVDKEAVMGSAWNGRYFVAIKNGAPLKIEWNQGMIKESAFVIPKGAKDAYWGQKMLALITDAKAQGIYANIITYPGLNLKSMAYVKPELQTFMPTHADNLPKQVWTDAKWWLDNGKEMNERWSKWILAK